MECMNPLRNETSPHLMIKISDVGSPVSTVSPRERSDVRLPLLALPETRC